MKFKIENIKKDIEFIEKNRNQWFPSGWSLKAKKIIKFLLDENQNAIQQKCESCAKSKQLGDRDERLYHLN